jgi:uncharacterized 2Fe-2S/4Fe-4S cluster protein (DUF4445 family)
MTSGQSVEAAYRIAFEPMNVAVDCLTSETLLDCVRRHRIRLATSCGGRGTCASCLVQFVDGSVPDASASDTSVISPERLAQGWRRACQTRPAGNGTVFVPPRSTAAPLRTNVEGSTTEFDLDPPVRIIPFKLSPPTIGDLAADDLRLQEAIEATASGVCRQFDAILMRTLPTALRDWGWQGWVASLGGEVIAMGKTGQPALGLAIDLGTTNISAVLVDLTTGTSLATKGIENPQTSFGADLITYASVIRRKPETAEQLRQLAVTALNQLGADLCREVDCDPALIIEATIAGNTMMHHLLLGLPVGQLAMSPFVSALSQAADVKARDLNLDFAPGGNIHFLPNIAGFVGGDHSATLLASETGTDQPVVIMDIGTNTEISLVDSDSITSVSCPSGPAFEGGHLSSGMRAAEGAIELVRIKGDEVLVDTIGEGSPVGICGSGVLDAVAQLHLAGICNARGQIQTGHDRVRSERDQNRFVLVGHEETGGVEIALTQDDIRAVQLAKGAIRAAVDQLLERTGYAEKDICQVVVAGAFGNYIDISSALSIGMLPDLPYTCFAQVGNAAGEGARLVLLSRQKRAEARDLARRAEYFELAGSKTFMKAFGARINFPQRVKAKPFDND